VIRVTVAPDGHVAAAKAMQGNYIARDAAEAVRNWLFKPVVVDGQRVSVVTYLSVIFVPPASGQTGAGMFCVRLLGSAIPESRPVPPECPGYGSNAIITATASLPITPADIGNSLARAMDSNPLPTQWIKTRAKDGFEFRLTGVNGNYVFFVANSTVMDWYCDDCSFFVWDDANIGPESAQPGVLFTRSPDGGSLIATCRAAACSIDLAPRAGDIFFDPITFTSATVSMPSLNVHVTSSDAPGGSLNLTQSNPRDQRPQGIFFYVTK
jgi:hypothetical protein